MRWIFPVVVLLICMQSLYAARCALLVGNAHGGSEVTALRYVDNDLKSIEGALTRYCGFEPDNIITLSGKGPAELHEALAALSRLLPQGDDHLLLLYYTGHADQDFLKMGNDRLAVGELKAAFSAFPATIRIGIIDACQSGSFTRLKGGKLVEPFLFRERGAIQGEVILSSSSSNENAQESDLLKNSIFTFHFVNALCGSGDASGDGKVTLGEAYQYCYNHTVASTVTTTGGVQHPGYQFRIQGQGDVVLSDLSTSSTGVLLESGVAGSVTMLDNAGRICADFTKEKSTRMIIALNPGVYKLIVGSEDTKKWWGTVKVPDGEFVPVKMAELQGCAIERSGSKGEQSGAGCEIGLSCGIGTYDFAERKRLLDEQFAPFSAYGVVPEFMQECMVVVKGARALLQMRSGVQFQFEYAGWEQGRKKQYAGEMLDVYSDRSYAMSLSVSEQNKVAIVALGAGYRIGSGVLKNGEIRAGLCFSRVTYTLAASTYDELYDLSLDKSVTVKGTVALPFAVVGYHYPLGKRIVCSMSAGYRYQKKDQMFFSEARAYGRERAEFPVALSGADLSFCVGYHFHVPGRYGEK